MLPHTRQRRQNSSAVEEQRAETGRRCARHPPVSLVRDTVHVRARRGASLSVAGPTPTMMGSHDPSWSGSVVGRCTTAFLSSHGDRRARISADASTWRRRVDLAAPRRPGGAARGRKALGTRSGESGAARNTIQKVAATLGAKSNKRCDRLNIFKTKTVQ